MVIWRQTWYRTIQRARKETRCRQLGYSFRLAARVILYASSHRQDNTYHGLCYTSRGALAGTRNTSMGPPLRIDLMTHRIMSERSYHGATSRSNTYRSQCLVFTNLRTSFLVGVGARTPYTHPLTHHLM